jgi:filamentous hemagglutinin
MTPIRSDRTACQRLVAGLLVLLQALPPTLYADGAWAQATLPITVDRSIPGQRPLVNVGANGVPVVQIAPPSAAGVSHNRFTDYNVGTSGVILNNSGGTSQTQLGGWVGGNPMLGNNKAATILNEVNGNAPSRLLGATEVAGNRANVIIANPNGISCNGCGFINAARATLVTGTPQFGADGSVAGFSVQRGQIGVDGAGLDARGADQLDLISRSLVLNAEVWANRLRVTTGANQVDYAGCTATVQAGAGDAPTVAIDVSQLGGMYANSIRMVGTEAGVGVNSAGVMSALTGELQLSSAGDVRITGGQVQAKGDLVLQGAGDVANAGVIHAEGNVSVTAANKLRNSSLIAATGNVAASAAGLANDGIIAAGVDARGQVTVASNLALNATGALQGSGQLLAGNDATLSANSVTLDGGHANAGKRLTIAAEGVISSRGGELIANDVVLTTGAGLDNTGGTLQATSLTVAAPRIDNTNGVILQTGSSGALVLSAEQGVVNKSGRIAANATDVTIAGKRIDNSGGAIEHAGSGSLHIAAVDALDNTQGSIGGNGGIMLESQTFANVDGVVQSQASLAINGVKGIDNTRGKLLTDGAAALTTQGAFNNAYGQVQVGQLDMKAGSVANNGGQILQFGPGDTVIAVDGAFNNAGGTLAGSGANLTLSAGSIDNTGGIVSHAGAGSLTVNGGSLLTNTAGSIAGNSKVAVTADTISNTAATPDDSLVQGQVAAGNTLDVNAATALNNNGGLLQGMGALTVESAALTNAGGAILSNDSATLNVAQLDNRDGVIVAKQLGIVATGIKNAGGTLQSIGTADGTIRAAQDIDNAGGIIAGNGKLVLVAANIRNQGGEITSGAALAATTSGTIDNTQGAIAAVGNVALTAGTLLVNNKGVIGSVQGKLATRSGGRTDNTGGRLEAAGDVAVVANSLANQDGIVSGGSTRIDTQGQALDNSRGKIGARSTLQIRSGRLDNGGGLIQAAGALDIDTQGQVLANTQSGANGGILGQGSVSIKAGQLDNRAGFIGGVGAMALTARQLDNVEGGTISGQGTLSFNSINGGGFNNVGGAVQVMGDASFDLGGGTLANRGSLLRSGGTLTVNASKIDNADTLGKDQGLEGASAKLTATTIANTSGAIRADNQLTIAASDILDNSHGTVSSADTVTVDAAGITNALGTLIAGKKMNVKAGSLSGDGKLLSLGDMQVRLTGSFNNNGQVLANGNLDFRSQGTITNSGTVSAGKVLNLNAANLDNLLAGEISAGTNNITVPGAINNQGLIDGRATRVIAGTLNNTGRVYGDHVAVQAGTLLNDTTGVIASRGNMDLGVGALINREHAILYSAGNLNLGGTLTDQNLASGVADNVINASATIESAGDMNLSSSSLVNRNEHFSMTTQELGTEQVTQYQLAGSTARLPASSVAFNGIDLDRLVTDSSTYPLARFGAVPHAQVIVQQCGGENICSDVIATIPNNDPTWASFGVAAPPAQPAVGPPVCVGGGDSSPQVCDDGLSQWRADVQASYVALNDAISLFNVDLSSRMSQDWYVYKYARTTSTSTVLTSDPARILSGGNMSLSGAVTNDKSQIVAGRVLNSTAASINNIGAQGTRTVTENGTVKFTELVADGLLGDSHKRNWGDPAPYNPAPEVITTLLPIGTTQQNTAAGTGTTVPAGVIISVTQKADGANQAVAQVDATVRSGLVSAATIPALPDATKAAVASVKTIDTPASGRPAAISSKPMAVRTAAPVVTLPNNALFQTHPEPGSRFLVETDPRFANYRDWASSDFMLQALGRDPDVTLKRLGDGFYEQKLVADQVLLATGQRFITGYGNNEDEYIALMQAGAAFGQQYQLNIGTALTEAQMSLLTTDIVWLVQRDVVLADGSVQSVLVPQVYVRVRDGDLQGDGTLMAGDQVRLNVVGDLANSGTIAGRSVTAVTADNIRNLGGRIEGGNVTLIANTDLDNLSGTILGNTVALQAGRDITLATRTIDTTGDTGGTGTRTGADRIATVYGDSITALAGRDIAVAGAQLNASGNVVLAARRDIVVGAVTTSSNTNITPSGHINEQVVQNLGSQVGAGGDLLVMAGQAGSGDLTIRGSSLAAGGNIVATGSNVIVQSAVDSRSVDMQTVKVHGEDILREHGESLAGGQLVAGGSVGIAATGVKGPDGKAISGTGDITLQGAQLLSGGTTALDASNNVNIVEQQLNQSSYAHSTYTGGTLVSSTSSTATTQSSLSQAAGSSINGGAVSIEAGNDVNVRGSDIVATGNIRIAAGNDVNIVNAQQSASNSQFAETRTSATGLGAALGIAALPASGLLKRSHTLENGVETETQAIGSTLSGNNIAITSARDTIVQGSTIVADRNIDINAGRNLSIVSAQDTATSESQSSSETSGSIGSFAQPSYGVVKQAHSGQSASTTQVGSQIASLGTDGAGNVTLTAGERYTQTASQVLAPKGDITIDAKDVAINAGFDTNVNKEHSEASQTAIGGGISVPMLNAVQGVAGMAQAAKDTGNGRMQALAAVNLAMGAKSVADSASAAANGDLTGVKVSISLGTSESQSDTVQVASTAVGSTIAAGGNVTIRATGAGKDSNLAVIGSNVSGGGNVALVADNKVILQAAQSTVSEHSTNSGRGSSIGIGLALGGQQSGFTLDLAASKSRGNADGDDASWSTTHITAGKTASIQSGGDTDIKGGIIAGNQVTATIGGNLNIESLQDTSRYDAKQESAGVGVSLCIPPFCYGASTVGGNFNSAKVSGDFASVTEQSGIKAGDGGFQVQVAGNTDLKGGVLSSSQGAIDTRQNTLTTATLTHSDVQNRDAHDADSIAVAGSVSGLVGNQGSAVTQRDKDAANTKPAPGAAGGIAHDSGAQTSTTWAGISGGAIVITDSAKQKALTGQDATATVASVKRDVTTGDSADKTGALTTSWNGAKALADIQAQATITQVFNQQAPREVAEYAYDARDEQIRARDEGLFRNREVTGETGSICQGRLCLSFESLVVSAVRMRLFPTWFQFTP